MTDNRRLDLIEEKLDKVIVSLAALREEVAGYRAIIAFLKWVIGLTLIPTIGAGVWIFKKLHM